MESLSVKQLKEECKKKSIKGVSNLRKADLISILRTNSDTSKEDINEKSIQLIHGDCLEHMKSIPTGSVDMILCDLPYQMTKNKWDIQIPMEDLWKHYNRIIK